jgi:hypothetical protein
MGFPNPAIAGSAIQRELAPGSHEATDRMDAVTGQATLDEQELRDLERAEYYGGPTTEPSGPTPPAVSEERGVRGLILRLTRSLRRPG